MHLSLTLTTFAFDDFLEEEKILGEAKAIAIKRVLAWQLQEEMKKRGMSKSVMAKEMNTSRSALDRFLDPNNISVTLKTMERAAAFMGKRLKVELEDIVV